MCQYNSVIKKPFHFLKSFRTTTRMGARESKEEVYEAVDGIVRQVRMKNRHIKILKYDSEAFVAISYL
jgi:hypothetical protein